MASNDPNKVEMMFNNQNCSIHNSSYTSAFNIISPKSTQPIILAKEASPDRSEASPDRSEASSDKPESSPDRAEVSLDRPESSPDRPDSPTTEEKADGVVESIISAELAACFDIINS